MNLIVVRNCHFHNNETSRCSLFYLFISFLVVCLFSLFTELFQLLERIEMEKSAHTHTHETLNFNEYRLIFEFDL